MNLFKRRKKIDTDISKLPTHIAFIMDGNGRWATSRGMPRTMGHKEGVNAMKRVVRTCYDFGIKVVSFFVFSVENWKRPQGEIDYIFNLAKEFSSDVNEEYKEKSVKLVTMGDLSKLPIDTQENIQKIKDDTFKNDKMIVNLAINYGGRDDIVNAVQKIINDKVIEPSKELISKYLYSSELPDPDMVIRSSGEQRLSNFMLYQMAYSEIYFIKKHWPDFNKGTVEDIIEEYQKRNRRYGGLV